ncbi:hypothetical protein AAC387_Pa03g3199 [Persea americana]
MKIMGLPQRLPGAEAVENPTPRNGEATDSCAKWEKKGIGHKSETRGQIPLGQTACQSTWAQGRSLAECAPTTTMIAVVLIVHASVPGASESQMATSPIAYVACRLS